MNGEDYSSIIGRPNKIRVFAHLIVFAIARTNNTISHSSGIISLSRGKSR